MVRLRSEKHRENATQTRMAAAYIPHTRTHTHYTRIHTHPCFHTTGARLLCLPQPQHPLGGREGSQVSAGGGQGRERRGADTVENRKGRAWKKEESLVRSRARSPNTHHTHTHTTHRARLQRTTHPHTHTHRPPLPLARRAWRTCRERCDRRKPR